MKSHTAPEISRTPVDLAVILLTLNEERNLPYALQSVCGWAKEVHIVDSGSTDNTARIARSFGCNFMVHSFENYSRQRNYTLDHLPVTAEWIFFLDADELLSEGLKEEIAKVIAGNSAENGFFVRLQLIWQGHEIRWGGYHSSWLLRLFRRGAGRCEERPVNEHLLVEGRVGFLKSPLTHHDRKGLSEWTAKHNRYASLEALEYLNHRGGRDDLPMNLFGCVRERKRWLRQKVWNRLPLFFRPWLFFAYRYFFCLGFLNRCFIFHFLQELWLHMLIDAKVVELRQTRGADKLPASPSHSEGRDQRRAGQAPARAAGTWFS